MCGNVPEPRTAPAASPRVNHLRAWPAGQAKLLSSGMRLLDWRHEGPLAVGVVAGTIVVFQRPLRWLRDIAGDVEQRYNLDLVPALSS